MGGTDEEHNISCPITVEDHAIAHLVLYRRFGNDRDRIAYETLSGMIGKEEAIRQLQQLGGLMTGAKNAMYERTPEIRKKTSDSVKALGRDLKKQYIESDYYATVKTNRQRMYEDYVARLEDLQSECDELYRNRKERRGKKQSPVKLFAKKYHKDYDRSAISVSSNLYKLIR